MRFALCALPRSAAAGWLLVLAVSGASAGDALPLELFRDGIAHWRNARGGEEYATHRPDDVRGIADNLLIYQRTNGGWPKDFDPLRMLDDAERCRLASEQQRRDTTFDNRATYPAVDYLARAFAATGETRYRDSARRGLEFMLQAQYPHGGWPHSYPNRQSYYPHVTIVDEVFSGVLECLRLVSAGGPAYQWVDAPLQARVLDAVSRGDACLLKLQVEVDGELTAWAGQYDSQTLQPVGARSYELPALISAESANVVRYLMRIEPPTAEVRRSIEAAVRWFERSKITGLRIDRVDAEPVRYENHSSRHDLVAVRDPQAPALWARYYEIDTNRPFLANRDGGKVYRLEDVERERRTGYSWYGRYAATLLERDYPAWERKWERK